MVRLTLVWAIVCGALVYWIGERPARDAAKAELAAVEYELSFAACVARERKKTDRPFEACEEISKGDFWQ